MSVSIKIKHFLASTLGRYAFIGVCVYVLELIIIQASTLIGLSPYIAVGLSFWIGLIVSFILQKFITFKDKRTHRKILIPQIIAVCALVLWNFAFTLLATKLLRDKMPVLLIRTLALGVTTIWNFYLYKTKIFSVGLAAPFD